MNLQKRQAIMWSSKIGKSGSRRQNLLLFMGALLFGGLGLFLTIPPGYTTSVSPVTGLAVAAALLYGARAGWALFALFFMLLMAAPTAEAGGWLGLLIALSLALLQCAHAFLTARLLRWKGLHNALEEPQDIVTLIVLAGLFSCFFSGFLSSIVLVLYGQLATEAFLFHWFIAWAGGCLGVCLFTPMLLILADTTYTISISRKRSVPLLLLLIYAGASFVTALILHYAGGDANQPVMWMAMAGLMLLTGLASMMILLITSQTDAVKRKVAEQSRRILAREVQLHTFLYYTPAAIAMLDRDLRYILTSEQWIEDFNLQERPVIGITHYDLFPDLRQHPDWLDASRKALEGNVVHTEEQVWTQAAGMSHVVAVSLHPWRDANGDISGIIVFSEDIGSQKRELAAKQALINKLAESNMDLERYAYICSHDLQEPLRTIANYVQRLERSLPDLNDTHRLYLKYLRDNAVRARQLIQGLLDYSRIGHSTDVHETCDTSAIAAAVCQQIETSIQASGAQITIEPMPSIYAPSSLVQQLFLNLFVNAIKFRKPGVAPIIHVSAQTLDGRHCFHVRDNGIGIAPEHQERIFAVFQRLHTTDEYPGMGIGLAICRRIADYLGGEICVTSVEGQGCVFTFSIPMRRELPAYA